MKKDDFCCAIVILTWNNIVDTIECVEGLGGGLSFGDIFVVDNGSSVDLFDRLKSDLSRFPKINIIRSEVNLGFAGGNDFGLSCIDHNKYTHLLLMNNDVIASPDSCRRLIEMSVDEKSDISGPLITYYPDMELVWQAGGYVIPFINHLVVPDKDSSLSTVDDVSVKPVDFVSGCVMLISFDYIKKHGFLDTRYFYSVEDLDYCLTAKSNGAKIDFFPQVVFHHKCSVTSGGWHSLFSAAHFLWGRGYLSTKSGRLIGFLQRMHLFLLLFPARLLKVKDPNRNIFQRASVLFKSAGKGVLRKSMGSI